MDPGWLGGPTPPLRLEVHYRDRVVPCFVERPKSLHALLAEAVTHNPGGEAVVCGDERLSWRDLDGRVSRLAAALARRGIGPGDRIAMLLGNGVPFVLTLFAAARLGAIAVPMSIRQQRPEIAFALADCGARALVHEPDLATRLPSPGEVPELRLRVSAGACAGSERLATLLDEDGVAVPAPVDEEDVAVILYTSGTTGRPKGATLTGLGIVHSSRVYEHCMALTDRDRIIAAVPLAHVTGLIANVTAAVRARATLVILPAFKAADFLALAERERATATVIAPAMYALCLLQPDFAARDLSAWRIGAYGGAPMPPATIEALARILPGLQLMNAYGSTETTSPVTLMPPRLTASHGDKVGLPVPGATVLAMDPEGLAVAPGEVGELWIAGPSVVPGYWNNPEATSREITGGFWHSGDLGTVDSDGFVAVLDRLKDMINRGGLKVYTAEVESVLAGHPLVVESAVVATPCPVLGERVHAVVVLREPVDATDSLRAFCATKLSDYKVPETFAFRAEPLPRNANGKVLKRELRPAPS